MSNLHDLMKQLQSEVKESIQMTFVYFDKETGRINKIGGVKEEAGDDEEIMEVLYDSCKDILEGKKRTSDFLVIYDAALKQKVLREKNYQDSYKEASQMCYKFPIIKKNRSGHINCNQIYDGVYVYLWLKSESYKRNDLVWYKGNVYRLLKDNKKGAGFPRKGLYPYIEDIKITNMPTIDLSLKELKITHEYEGVHVDIWYNELEHLGGQHVWIGNCIYKIKENQEPDTDFNPDNAEMIISNVKLFNDANKSLQFEEHIGDGDLYLDHNKVYSAAIIDAVYSKSSSDVLFYSKENKFLSWNEQDNSFFIVDPFDTQNYSIVENTEVEILSQTSLKTGDKVLIGKKLYQVELDKEYDIIVKQDKQQKHWSFEVNPTIRDFLVRNNNDVMYVSVTRKHDPNILHRSLRIPISDLGIVEIIPFDHDSEMDNVSLYTAKYFDSYAHEVIEN